MQATHAEEHVAAVAVALADLDWVAAGFPGGVSVAPALSLDLAAWEFRADEIELAVLTWTVTGQVNGSALGTATIAIRLMASNLGGSNRWRVGDPDLPQTWTRYARAVLELLNTHPVILATFPGSAPEIDPPTIVDRSDLRELTLTYRIRLRAEPFA